MKTTLNFIFLTCMIIALVNLSSCNTTQGTGDKKNGVSDQKKNNPDNSQENGSDKKIVNNNQDTLNKENFNQSDWPQTLKEGWISSSQVQALLTASLGESREVLLEKTRERLAWLMLLDGYNVDRSHSNFASQLAASKSFQSFGEEVIFEKKDDSKYSIIVRRQATDLEAQWAELKDKIDKRDSALKAVRKKKY